MSKKTKAIICVLAFVCALACGIGAYAAYPQVVLLLAEQATAQRDYDTAREQLDKIDNERADALLKYISLREDINKQFPVLLEEFDIEVIKGWNKTAASLGRNKDSLLKEDFAFEAQQISKALTKVDKGNDEYLDSREATLSFFDLFAELGRLHSKVDGKNVSFTVAQEREKLAAWRETYNTLSDYSGKYFDTGSTYLLSYLVNEAGSEFTTLESAIDVILQSGYSEDDIIRYNDEIHTMYPDITSLNGEAVNLLDKQKYEQCLYKDICTGLVSTLAEFYAVKG